ncbi:MAG: RecX family transcriptional regulator [Methylomonas sp.]|nr:MAG: RecX family transcriptional regulator [Methylomonas sp.]PPD25616.1 MAG: RecX family transcriptional regulator [Methylomonas sp.]PPD36617.1 MAG: RecX family transcriptional regulator [Methylomonas sp.]PPD39940.1 MAG: RecX family transcriptional regulator [Methylomonas sp.]PPD52771.1 MAG: RecX family transcriptional regulator [Methylomonas sp.]
MLARREHSRRELFDKLALRGYERSEVEVVIDELVGQNWQSDERYTEIYVRDRIAKGYGPLRIAYELQQRGIEGVDLDAQADEQGGWLNLALDAYQGKYDDAKALALSEWAKRSRFLQQRGFNGETIKQVFGELKIKLAKADAKKIS